MITQTPTVTFQSKFPDQAHSEVGPVLKVLCGKLETTIKPGESVVAFDFSNTRTQFMSPNRSFVLAIGCLGALLYYKAPFPALILLAPFCIFSYLLLRTLGGTPRLWAITDKRIISVDEQLIQSWNLDSINHVGTVIKAGSFYFSTREEMTSIRNLVNDPLQFSLALLDQVNDTRLRNDPAAKLLEKPTSGPPWIEGMFNCAATGAVVSYCYFQFVVPSKFGAIHPFIDITQLFYGIGYYKEWTIYVWWTAYACGFAWLVFYALFLRGRIAKND